MKVTIQIIGVIIEEARRFTFLAMAYFLKKLYLKSKASIVKRPTIQNYIKITFYICFAFQPIQNLPKFRKL
jgi:hypothetical protein